MKKLGSVIFIIVVVLYFMSKFGYFENEKRYSHNTEISKLEESEPQLSNEPTEEEMIGMSMEYVPKMKEMYDNMYSHYLNLFDEYKKQKISFDINSWTVFLNTWNRDLKDYRTELDSYKVTGYVYDLFYAKNQLSMAGTDMAVVWLYYNGLLEDASSKDAYDNLMYFTETIENYFKESKVYLDKY